MRSRWLWITLSLGVIAVVWGGLSWVEERRFRRELSEAEAEMARGLNQLARQRLSRLTNQRPGSDRAAYQLGSCEEILGHFDAALTVWSQIPAKSSFASKAALGRARLFMNTGRFAPAEELLQSLPRDRGNEAEQARHALQLLLHFQGRTGEIRQLIYESWARSID